LTKSITLLALACLLVAGAAAASILSRDSIPAAGVAASLSDISMPVVSNREAKQDKLTVAALPETPVAPVQAAAVLSEPMRQAYASSSDTDIEAARTEVAKIEVARTEAAKEVTTEPVALPAPPKPKAASHPQLQKTYAFLSDAQISGIKERLHLTSDQEYYWPGIEQALRGIARKVQAARQSNPNANAASIDPDSAEVQQLKSAAMPLLFQLREDQKEEVRKLARVIGLEKVASAI
jgi:Tfp pilus assembly major pilin PilA